MSTQAKQNSQYPIYERGENIRDALLVSSFGLWAALLGFLPVLAFHLLAGA